MEVICMNIRNDAMAKTFPPRSTSSFPSSIFTSPTLLLRHLITFYQVEISRNFNRKMNGSLYLLVENKYGATQVGYLGRFGKFKLLIRDLS